MTISNRQEPLVLLLGDIFLFVLSLWVALYARFFSVPTWDIYMEHLAPFFIIFTLSIIIFFIGGLYEKHTLILRSKIPSILLNTQVINSLVAIAFFYLIPFFGITPKTILFLYLVVSSILIFIWRVYGYKLIVPTKRQKALLIGSGDETHELYKEINENSRYRLCFVSRLDLDKASGVDIQEEIIGRIYSENVSVVVADFMDERVEPILPKLYNLVFSKISFIDMHKVYEDTFDRMPLSLLKYSWFLENISRSASTFYDGLKRVMDIALSLPVGLFTLLLYPFVSLAIFLEDRGPVIITQRRTGHNNKEILVHKFRTMERYEDGVWIGETPNKVTRVGRILRVTSIDELPQIWDVLMGELSLIGPRSDVVGLEKRLREEIPYYNVRYVIKPGISGWAQIKQSYAPGNISPQSLEESKIRLAYDLYYIKNRSLMLDLKIALHTVRAILSRLGI